MKSLTLIRSTLALFTRAERRELYIVFAAVLAVAILEVLGIASIMPFLTVVSNPEMIQEQRFLRWLWEYTSPSSTNSFLFGLGLTVFVLIVLTNLFNALSYWLIQRFTWMRHHTLSTRLLARYLRQPWTFYLNRNTSELSTNILSEVQQFISQYLMSGMQLIAQGCAGLLILGLLIAVDPLLAFIVSTVVGGAYVLIFFGVRRKQLELGETRRSANALRFRLAAEAMGGMKDVKVQRLEDELIQRYERPSLTYSRSQATNAVIALTPRYLLEILAFGSVMLILLYELGMRGDASQVIPVVGLYAFAGFRLLPKMQAMFYAGSSMRFTGAILDTLRRDLLELERNEEPSATPLAPLEHSFGLREVTFVYPNADRPALDAIDLDIPRRCSVALVGATGSGKTTCVDVLLGLLTPQQGGLVVDGEELTPGEVVSWRSQCGYVPQQIFLTDDTLAANVAFGVPEEQRDMEAIRTAVRIANLQTFIEEELPDGYETIVGERGVRLSGGQRQRIGIARALYHDPEVLIFDEATSALDNVTERAIMEAIEELAGKKTLIMIAHRLSTVRMCDRIYLFDHGKIANAGTWEELMDNSVIFQELNKPEDSSAA